VHAWVEPRVPVYQPGHWLGLVTRLGWLGQAQPKKKRKKEKRVGQIWALGPTDPNYVY